MSRKIVATAEHLALLKCMAFDWDNGCEFGAIASDCKRPFGNGDVDRDVSKILGREVDWQEATRLVAEMSALVAGLVRRASDLIAPGDEFDPPWRAERELESIAKKRAAAPRAAVEPAKDGEQ